MSHLVTPQSLSAPSPLDSSGFYPAELPNPIRFLILCRTRRDFQREHVAQLAGGCGSGGGGGRTAGCLSEEIHLRLRHLREMALTKMAHLLDFNPNHDNLINLTNVDLYWHL